MGNVAVPVLPAAMSPAAATGCGNVHCAPMETGLLTGERRSIFALLSAVFVRLVIVRLRRGPSLELTTSVAISIGCAGTDAVESIRMNSSRLKPRFMIKTGSSSRRKRSPAAVCWISGNRFQYMSSTSTDSMELPSLRFSNCRRDSFQW